MVANALSIYSEELTDAEIEWLDKRYPPTLHQFIIHPALVIFAQRHKEQGYALEMLQVLGQNLVDCDCWYCSVLKKKEVITMRDVWLKMLRELNGAVRIQIN